MTNEKLIAKANKLADQLQRVRKQLRPRRQRVKSDRPRGRPAADKDKLAIAKDLVGRDFPITDVALKVGIGVRTMYDHGISRKQVEKEKLLTVAAGQ